MANVALRPDVLDQRLVGVTNHIDEARCDRQPFDVDFPREQRVSPDRPAAVQGAKRRSVPLTARTDLESSRARGKGVGCRRDWTNGLLALVNRTARHFRNIFAAAILALRP